MTRQIKEDIMPVGRNSILLAGLKGDKPTNDGDFPRSVLVYPFCGLREGADS